MGIHQEVSFREVVRAATTADLLALIDPSAVALLKTLRPEVLGGDDLKKFVLAAGTVSDYLIDPARRDRVLSLLATGEARLLAAQLDLNPIDDPHKALRSASNGLTQRQLDCVFAFFGADETLGAGGLSLSAAVQQASSGYPLFAYQRNAIARLQDRLYAGTRRVVLHMPTGAGKTRTAMSIVAEHLRKHEPTVVVWLAFSEELLEQAASEFETAWAHIGNRTVEIVRFWGGRTTDLTWLTDGLVVAGLSKMYAASQKNLNLIPTLGDLASLVIIDEAHQSIAETYAFLLDILATKRRGTSLLGLTATPGRTYSDIEQDARLSQFWTGTKVMLEIEGYDNPVTYLIEEGYLARPEFRTIYVNPGISPTVEDLQRMRQSLDLPAEILSHLAEDELWNTAVVDATRDLLSRHRRVLVFATTVRQAIVLSAVMRALDYNARTVTGTTPKAERESVLQQYTINSTKPMVLFNYGVLTAGFDAPVTSAIVIARPTKSLVLFSQMVGRAMRGKRAGGNERCEIVTVIDPALPGFGDPADAFTNWEDVW